MADHPTNDDIHLIDGRFWGRDPHRELTWMRENAPVYWDARSGVWGISTHADVRLASLHPEIFSSAEGIRPDNALGFPMMIDMDDPEHLRRRRLVNRGFTPRRVAEQEARIRQVCDAILDRVCERGECDFVWDIAAPLPLIMIADALGIAPHEHQTLMRWSDDMLRSLGQATDDLLVAAGAAFEGYSGCVSAVIEDRRAQPRDDLISVLVHAEIDGERLDQESLIFETLLILIGGDETTRHVISGGAFQLCRHPAQRRSLIDDPALIPVAVEEMLRWVSPIKNMNRTLTRDFALGGEVLRKGDKALLLYSSANRDAAVFADPFRFDARRRPNDHLAFGVGSHFCLGNSLARLELRVMFERLLARLPDLEPATDTEPEHRPANFVSGYESMPVRFTPTRPSSGFH